ncbi:hypothetical protein L596_007604 [Steinernema carpocapsae]|uniref:Uncharacterized protein n=1 Tax=Steinernema carpocapsae TaxID=34508 RepID=A0A4U5P9U5_STECR|nr:hypothetical protein L596_007604 [Steinernema carpocapsae]
MANPTFHQLCSTISNVRSSSPDDRNRSSRRRNEVKRSRSMPLYDSGSQEQRQEFSADVFFYKNLVRGLEESEETVIRLREELQTMVERNKRVEERLLKCRLTWDAELLKERERYVRKVTLATQRVEQASIARQETKRNERLTRVWNTLQRLRKVQSDADQLERLIRQNAVRTRRLKQKFNEFPPLEIVKKA